MKKVFSLSFLMGIFLIISSISVFAADDSGNQISAEVRTAAEKELTNFQNMISERYYKYNFNSAEEVKSTKLGKGYQVLGLDQEKLDTGNSNKILDIVKPLNQWSFVVTLNDQPKMLLTIGLENGKYILIGAGGDASAFDDSLSKVTSNSENAKLARIHDVDMLVSEGPQGEIKQSISKKFSIADDFVTKLRESKTKYNDKGEVLYGGSNAEGLLNTPTTNKDLTMIYGSAAVLSLLAIGFVMWKFKKPRLN